MKRYLSGLFAAVVIVCVPAVSLAGFFGFGGDHQAVADQYELKQKVIIKESGRIYVDGKPSRQTKLDILDDKYVFRYKVLDKPAHDYSQVTVDVQLPESVSAFSTKLNVLAVHGIGDIQQQPLNRSTIEVTIIGVSTEATITLVADLPKSAFHFSKIGQLLAYIQTMPLWVLVSIGIAIPSAIIIYALFLLITRLQDIFLRPAKQLITEPPANLPPAMVGTLIHGYAGMREIAATIIDLAHRGYIEIIYRGDQDFAFSRKKQWEYDASVQEYEKLFLAQIFGESQTFLTESSVINQQLNKHIWSESITHGIESLYAQMVKLGYFPEDPRTSHMRIRFIGELLFFVSVIGVLLTLFLFEQRPIMVVPWVISMISSPLLIHLSLLVPRRSSAGRELASRWLAYRNYLVSGLILKNLPTGSAPEIFERYLASTIVLSVEQYWTQLFIELPCRIPDWFFVERNYLTTYQQVSQTLFSIIGFMGIKFSSSRKPTAL